MMALRRLSVFPFVVAVFAIAAAPTAHNNAPPQEAASIESQVAAADAARFRAMTSGDIDGVSRLLADNLVYVHSSGSIETKTQFLEILAALPTSRGHFLLGPRDRTDLWLTLDPLLVDPQATRGLYTVQRLGRMECPTRFAVSSSSCTPTLPRRW
jgi:hypothetical protein